MSATKLFHWAARLSAPLLAVTPTLADPPVIHLGQSSYYASLPDGAERPSDSNGQPVSPRVSPGFDQPIQTNEFWSSWIFPRYSNAPFGTTVHAHPHSVRAQADGLRIGYDTVPWVSDRAYGYDLETPSSIVAGLVGLNAPNIRTASYGDWHVTAEWPDPAHTMRATVGHGMPVITIDADPTQSARVTFGSAPTVFADLGDTLGVAVGGIDYALFAPPGSDWTITGSGASTVMTAPLGTTAGYAVAPLPSRSDLNLFRAHAFAFVTDTRVEWSYDPATSDAVATFIFETQPRDGIAASPIIALYRHQWLHTDLTPDAAPYTSARGQMRTSAASSFTCRFPFHGVLPAMADTGALDPAELSALINIDRQNMPAGGDTYWSGKQVLRAAQLIPLAVQADDAASRDALLAFVKQELGDWLAVGVPVGGRDAFGSIKAASYDAASGVAIETDPDRGQIVTGISGGDWLRFDDVVFDSRVPVRVMFTVASNTPGSGLIEVRLDSPTGPVLSGGGFGSTGSTTNWNEVVLGISAGAELWIEDTHDLYITCSTPYPGELIRLDTFRFDAGGGGPARSFAYDDQWDTLLGSPGSYGLAGEMNDHNFHYGYHIFAAAQVAMQDPQWAADRAGLIELMIRDAANWDRTDTRFPFLRCFDPYAGHSWAAGHQGFDAGNNQESSSEAMNFATALILWGSVTGNQQIRDLGIYLHASETVAIEQYWFDVDSAVYPPAQARDIAGIVWSNGMAYATWWTANPEEIHGINFLPITGGSLYLGRNPHSMPDNYALLTAENGGPPVEWAGVIYSALALADPDTAYAQAASHPNFNIEAGDSLARTTHWLFTLKQTGAVDPSVTADMPTAAAFSRDDDRTYMAWNPATTPATVTYSDGFAMTLAPGELRAGVAGDACPADLAAPFGTLDFFDLSAFLGFFNTQNPAADLAPPIGSFDFFDVSAFLTAFNAGCP